MTEDEIREQDAYISLLSTFESERKVVSVADLNDGAPLLAVLQTVYVVSSTLRRSSTSLTVLIVSFF